MSQALPILQIALPSPFRRLFEYLPLENQALPAPGSRVSIPFGRQKAIVGIVIGHSDKASTHHKLRSIHSTLDEYPALSPAMLKLCQWCADYYHYPLGEVCYLALPAALRKPETMPPWQESGWFLTPEGKDISEHSLPKNARLQRSTLQFFQQNEWASKADLSQAGISSSTIKTFTQKGWLEEKILDKDLPAKSTSAENLLKQTPLPLNSEQQYTLNQLHLDHFKTHLIEGVTGSGKTEVYLQAIHQVLQNKRQVLVLVPEIGLTPQTLERFQRRFSCTVAALHSGLNDKQRYTLWQQAKNNQLQIVIGTRSSVFTPLSKLGLIIVDEEHDLSYKQQDGVRYSARDLAIVRAQQLDIPLILGSATPSLESLNNALMKRYIHCSLTYRANQQAAPTLRCIDGDENKLTTETQELIQQHLSQGQQVLLFINRRGYAPTLICQDCGWISQCNHCDSRMTLHQSPYAQKLHCHQCDARADVPHHCPECQSKQLKALGSGTQRSEQDLEQLFPSTPILRIDRDTVSKKGEWQQMLDKINSGQPCIMVGTQMLAKGHHFANLGLAVLLGVDNGLFSSDFRGPERMGQLLTQVAGRVGREKTRGQVIIQTQFADHPTFNAWLTKGYHHYAEQLLAERRLSAMPPLSHLALLRCHAQKAELALAFLHQGRRIAEKIAPPSQQIQYLGPFPATIERKNNRYHYFLQIKSEQRLPRQALLKRLCEQLEGLKQAQGLHWLVDVDPQEF